MSQYLFLFSISPVQAYIEQARKTQDLYAGSFILSYLCYKAIQASGIPEEQLIFPKFEYDDPPQSLSNRFLAIVHKESDGEKSEETILKAYGEDIQTQVEETFMAIAKKAISDDACQISYQAQVKHYLNIQWAFLPIEEGKYAETYDELERMMGAIKHVRAFSQLPEKGRKCSICGERNVKFYRKNESDDRIEKGNTSDILKKKKLFTEEVCVTGYKTYRPFSPKTLQPGEGLCAVCFMKRNAEHYDFQSPQSQFLRYDNDFPSTPEIALLDAFYQKDDDQNVVVDRAVWQGKHYEGHVIFDLKEMSKQKVRERYTDLSDEELSNSLAIAEEFTKKEITISPYYAIFCFDGDNMGKWLSGAYLKPGATVQRFHQELSKTLMTFAQQVRDLFQDHPEWGHVIYTGGDDFLGFVSLNSIFSVMKELRQTFDNIDLSEFIEPEHKLTFSAGAVIAHLKTPLSEVLKWARDMEHAAKDISDKDAFAIAVLKHSGEIQQTIFKWREEDAWVLDVCERIIQRIRHDEFSGTFLNNLDSEFRRLLNPDGTLEHIEFLEPETKRLLQRSYQLRRQRDESKEKFGERKREAIETFLNDMRTLYNSSLSNLSSFENVLFALGIIDFFTRKVTL